MGYIDRDRGTFLDRILLNPFSNLVSRFLSSLGFKDPRDSPNIFLQNNNEYFRSLRPGKNSNDSFCIIGL